METCTIKFIASVTLASVIIPNLTVVWFFFSAACNWANEVNIILQFHNYGNKQGCILYFLADLGGIIGFFLGGSALSMFELIDVFIYSLALHIHYTVKRSGAVMPGTTH